MCTSYFYTPINMQEISSAQENYEHLSKVRIS